MSDDDSDAEDDEDALPVVDSPIEVDEKSYLASVVDDCPKHGLVMPVALPYIVNREDARQPDGYHLVCPRCRHAFEEYEVTNQQWMGR